MTTFGRLTQRKKWEKKVGALMAEVGEADLLLPPVKGWEYYDCDGRNYKSDPMMKCSRKVSPASLDSITKKEQEEEKRRKKEEFREASCLPPTPGG